MVPEFNKWKNDQPMEDGLHIWLATWCPFSVQMYDAISELRNQIDDSDIVMKVYNSTDLPKNTPKIQGYPAIFFVKDGNAYRYNGKRESETIIKNLEDFFNEDLEVQKSELEQEESDTNIMESIGKYIESLLGRNDSESKHPPHRNSMLLVESDDETGDPETTEVNISGLPPQDFEFLEKLLTQYME